MTNLGTKADRLLLKPWVEKKTKSINRGIRWSLDLATGSKGERTHPEGCIPNYRRPVEELAEGFTMERVVSEMNLRNCFDFDYTPREKHVLRLYGRSGRAKYGYFMLMYQKGKWEPLNSVALSSVTSKNVAGGTAQWQPLETTK